jgi:hypothetical protein
MFNVQEEHVIVVGGLLPDVRDRVDGNEEADERRQHRQQDTQRPDHQVDAERGRPTADRYHDGLGQRPRDQQPAENQVRQQRHRRNESDRPPRNQPHQRRQERRRQRNGDQKRRD